MIFFEKKTASEMYLNETDAIDDIYEIGYFDVEIFRCKEQRRLKPSKSCGLRTKFKALQQYLTFVKLTPGNLVNV